MANLFEQDRSYILGDPELDIIGDRDKLAQWRHKGMGPAYYTPHAAKHTIAAERDRRRLTMVQRKAWSENMGHENEQITTSHYGKLTHERRLALLDELPLEDEEGTVLELTDEQKIALVNEVLERVGSHRGVRP